MISPHKKLDYLNVRQLREIVREEVKAAIAEDRAEQSGLAWEHANKESMRIGEQIRKRLDEIDGEYDY